MLVKHILIDNGSDLSKILAFNFETGRFTVDYDLDMFQGAYFLGGAARSHDQSFEKKIHKFLARQILYHKLSMSSSTGSEDITEKLKLLVYQPISTILLGFSILLILFEQCDIGGSGTVFTCDFLIYKKVCLQILKIFTHAHKHPYDPHPH